jgi:hypothetical protein
MQRDTALLIQSGYTLERIRETATLREWVVSADDGRATRIQWTRDTSWLFYPPISDAEFGFTLSFEDLAVNKMAAAADRGRLRDYHDLAALDLQGVPPWVLALAAMGKDAELSPPAVLEQALRFIPQAGLDDEDPDYEGPSIRWPAVRRYITDRLREDLALLGGFRWADWAGALPISKTTGRLALGLQPEGLAACGRQNASAAGAWPSSPAVAGEMLRRSSHPELAGVTLDLSRLLN